MIDNNEDRIAKLSKRFKTHAAGRPRDNSRQRERQSLYLDANLMERVDDTYKEVAHALYPKSVGKSTFLEAILEFGLENLDTIKSQLSETAKVS